MEKNDLKVIALGIIGITSPFWISELVKLTKSEPERYLTTYPKEVKAKISARKDTLEIKTKDIRIDLRRSSLPEFDSLAGKEIILSNFTQGYVDKNHNKIFDKGDELDVTRFNFNGKNYSQYWDCCKEKKVYTMETIK